MKLRERTRWSLALAGPILIEIASFMPLFGGGAKHLYRCGGREFAGTVDDCNSDYLPLAEMLLPFLALLLLYPFARLAFSLFAPDPDKRTLKWRLATTTPLVEYFPSFHVMVGMGLAWTLWRALTYPLIAEMWPFLLFWAVFATWFTVGLAVAWPRRELN